MKARKRARSRWHPKMPAKKNKSVVTSTRKKFFKYPPKPFYSLKIEKIMPPYAFNLIPSKIK
jgi:hypothetical protein